MFETTHTPSRHVSPPNRHNHLCFKQPLAALPSSSLKKSISRGHLTIKPKTNHLRPKSRSYQQLSVRHEGKQLLQLVPQDNADRKITRRAIKSRSRSHKAKTIKLKRVRLSQGGQYSVQSGHNLHDQSQKSPKKLLILQAQNDKLVVKLNKKRKMIERLKLRIRNYESQLGEYEGELETIERDVRQGRNDSADRSNRHQNNRQHSQSQKKYSRSKYSPANSYEKQGRPQQMSSKPKQHSISHRSSQQLIESSQQLARQAIEKYKKLEAQFEMYKRDIERYQKNIEKQKHQSEISKGYQLLNHNNGSHSNDSLKYPPLPTSISQHKGVKKQLSMKLQGVSNHQLESPQKTHQKPRNTDKSIGKKRQIIVDLTNQNQKLKEHIYQITNTLETERKRWANRQSQLKVHLQAIEGKVAEWEEAQRNRHQQLAQECVDWSNKYRILQDKYDQMKARTRRNGDQWGAIFKDFLQEVQRLKREINALNDKNLELIRLYVKY